MREYQARFRGWTTETVSSFTYEYDLSGLIKKETSTQDGSTVERIYAYDDRCQIIAVNERVTTDCGKTWNVQDTYYTYDNAGNCIKEEVKRSSTTLYYTDYQYNAADQLTKKVLSVGSLKATTNYSYDKNGNLIKESNTYNMSYSAACKCIKAYASLTISMEKRLINMTMRTDLLQHMITGLSFRLFSMMETVTEHIHSTGKMQHQIPAHLQYIAYFLHLRRLIFHMIRAS